MTHPTDPAAAMREACAREALGLAGANIYKAMICDEIAAAIRALPLPTSPPDPRDEALRLAREAMVDYQRAGFRYGDAALAAIDALKE